VTKLDKRISQSPFDVKMKQLEHERESVVESIADVVDQGDQDLPGQPGVNEARTWLRGQMRPRSLRSLVTSGPAPT
jgi:hypothetical protein